MKILDSWQPTRGYHPIVGASCWDHFMFPGFPSPFYLPNLFFLFLFPLIYLSEFPFYFIPSISTFLVTILSRFSKRWVRGLVDLWVLTSLHIPIIMSPTDLCVILYLTIFRNHGFVGSRFYIPSSATTILHQKIWDLHYDRQNYCVYQVPKYFISYVSNSDWSFLTLSLFSIIRNRGFKGSQVRRFTKFPKS
jgi:hypothetical protein